MKPLHGCGVSKELEKKSLNFMKFLRCIGVLSRLKKFLPYKPQTGWERVIYGLDVQCIVEILKKSNTFSLISIAFYSEIPRKRCMVIALKSLVFKLEHRHTRRHIPPHAWYINRHLYIFTFSYGVRRHHRKTILTCILTIRCVSSTNKTLYQSQNCRRFMSKKK